MSYKEAVKKIKDNKIEKLYLLYGEEVYLMEKFMKELKTKVVGTNFEDLNFFVLEGKDFTVTKLVDTCETLPFMAERKLVVVNDLDVFQSKRKTISEKDEESFIDYLGKLPDTTCLVFNANNTVDARKKAVKTIQKKGNVIQFQKLNAKELKEWIEKLVKKCGKIMGVTEFDFFMGNIDYIGKNAKQSLLDIENEIKKIVAFIGDKEVIELKDLEAIFTSNLQNDIFKLLDAIEKRRVEEAIKRLNRMLYEGEPVIKIAATLGNQVRNLLKTKLLLEEGYSSKAVASKIGIHPFVASKCANQCKGFRVEELEALLNRFLQMDVMIKSGKMKDTIALELFIIEMCKN
ncbi:DNA polymerase III subunit delta [Natronincola ferrireducens]|uniref:DNA polymerase III subunit delta n=1 Tax=Natronincola ferrireducens TaxID=393762 RepID=A0A1G9BCG4_9FIRM|nr:DNA polymerase III subunit delta [Natronincola ferrireducens]SDK37149.1 DNA polymerase III, delta subunit [Natronincola ferrireducens]